MTKKPLTTKTARLTATYLAVVMVLSIGFSVVFYHTTFKEVLSQVPPHGLLEEYTDENGRKIVDDEEIKHAFADRIAEGRESLLVKLAIANGFNVIIGGMFCYYLARLSLRPYRENINMQVQFVSDASHELRTPLTAIQTINEVALRNNDLTLAEAKDVISQNVDEVIGLRKLTDGLLRLARHNAQPLEMKEVALQDVVTNAVNQVIKPAQEKNVHIEERVRNVKISADADSLATAFAAVLDNAVRYSEPGGTVYIRSMKKNKEAHITIRDTGEGISPEDMPYIFKRFYRADASRTKDNSTGGYGIGLSITDKIIEHHGGVVSVHSEEGKGTTFTFKLPIF